MWWARQDSNLQPSGYEPLALTIELRAPGFLRPFFANVQTAMWVTPLPCLFQVRPPQRLHPRVAASPPICRPGYRSPLTSVDSRLCENGAGLTTAPLPSPLPATIAGIPEPRIFARATGLRKRRKIPSANPFRCNRLYWPGFPGSCRIQRRRSGQGRIHRGARRDSAAIRPCVVEMLHVLISATNMDFKRFPLWLGLLTQRLLKRGHRGPAPQ
jgi:hypothetical protein